MSVSARISDCDIDESPAPGRVAGAMRSAPATRYVLVTPVRDEAGTVEQTLQSVLVQTILPCEWVIVSDGSTDGTNAIVSKYAQRYTWIRLIERPHSPERSFASVVHSTETGIRHLVTDQYDFVGLVDADVVFQPNYFEELLRRFASEPRLGLGGGLVIDSGGRRRTPRNRSDVPGAVQFYRRECFDNLGGLCAIPEGGWDAVACAMARMHGYRTRLFADLVVDHLKPRNVSQGGPYRRRWQMGMRDYVIGYRASFELVKCVGRIRETPILGGAVAWWLGYCAAALQRRRRVVPPRIIAFIRQEQGNRLRQLFRLSRLRPRGSNPPSSE